MVAQPTQQNHSPETSPLEVIFAGNNVQLAGQIDYPKGAYPASGFPLIFVIQHATCTARAGFAHIARLGSDIGAAVFRWDKRGTGRSGSAAGGDIAVDTLQAYRTAISQAGIDSERVIIFAQNEGSLLLGENFAAFKDIQQPAGVILAGNMLDEQAILNIDAPLHILVSKNDWNAWQIYAEKAAKAHGAYYGYAPSYYVAPNTNRLLMYTGGNTFHRGSEESIKDWLKTTCQIS